MTDVELREAACRLGASLVDELGPVVQKSFRGRVVDDAEWHHPWPTTIDMFVRTVFMTSLDAFGSATVGLQLNASAASVGNLRTVAESHVLLRWVLDGQTSSEQRARVLALTSASLKRTRTSLGHWERVAEATNASEMAKRIRQALDATEADLMALAARNALPILTVPSYPTLFDRFLPGGYFIFAILSNIGAHSSPSALFYVNPGRGVVDWDYNGLNAERAFWVTQGCAIELENAKLTAPVCGWAGHAPLLERVEKQLAGLEGEAVKRFIARRDPSGKLT